VTRTIPKKEKVKIKKEEISKSFCIIGKDKLEEKRRRRIFWTNFYQCRKCKARYCKEHFYKWMEKSDICFVCEKPIRKRVKGKKAQEKQLSEQIEEEHNWNLQVVGPVDPVVVAVEEIQPEIIEVIEGLDPGNKVIISSYDGFEKKDKIILK